MYTFRRAATWIRRLTTVATKVGRQDVVWQTGDLGLLADGSCTLQMGKTTVLAAAVCSKDKSRSSETLPLQVERASRRLEDCVARRYPSDREVGIGGCIERAVRPLFPCHLGHDVCITATVLSTELDPDIVAINAASGALMCSDIPWYGPIGACKVAVVDSTSLVDPAPQDLKDAQLVLTFAGTRDKVVLLEAQGKEASLDQVCDALDKAQERCRQMIESQMAFLQQRQTKKRSLVCAGADPTGALRVQDMALPLFEEMYALPRDKATHGHLFSEAKTQLEQKLEDMGAIRSELRRIPGSGCVTWRDLMYALMMTENKVLRRNILQNWTRLDGRRIHDMRPMLCQTDVVPVVHGSALFQRGKTQSICTATVGNDLDRQRPLTIFGVREKPLIVQCSSPSYAVNEISRYRGVARRDIEHSLLAERALSGVMPDPDMFPFPVSAGAEIISSDGSMPMACVSGISLALGAAGVPMRNPVAGIHIGLVTDFEKNFFEHEVGEDTHEPPARVNQSVLLTDVQEIEQSFGDMDFAIAGTKDGFVALRLDTQLPGGIAMEIVKEALVHSQKPLMQTVESMNAALADKKADERCPTFGSIDVDPDAMGAVIGKERTNIQRIEEAHRVRLVQSKKGNVAIYGATHEDFKHAEERILDLQGHTIHKGEVYSAKVVRLMDYGALLELPNGFHCLLHISQISENRIASIRDELSEGQTVRVKCIGTDVNGNIVLSRKELLE